MLDAAYITAAEHRARRFSGAYTGTSGTLAADVIRLLHERTHLMSTVETLEDSVAALRSAVADRMASTDPSDPKMQGYTPMAASLAGCRPAHEAAARCFDTATDPSPTTIADSDTPAIPEDYILQGHRELKGSRAAEGWRRALESTRDARQDRLRGDGILAATPDDDVSPSERMLLDAAAAVRDRRRRYGPPKDHFTITINLINARFGTAFKPEDWATMMQLDKIARSAGPGDHPDNDIDGAGYAACRAECRAP